MNGKCNGNLGGIGRRFWISISLNHQFWLAEQYFPSYSAYIHTRQKDTFLAHMKVLLKFKHNKLINYGLLAAQHLLF